MKIEQDINPYRLIGNELFTLNYNEEDNPTEDCSIVYGKYTLDRETPVFTQLFGVKTCDGFNLYNLYASFCF
jgi:hypothetical protein